MSITLEDVRQMPLGQRIQFIEDAWDTVAAEGADLPLTPQQEDELDRRRADMMANPSSGIPWKEAKARLLAGS
jgi:putative addiction module component (TIGR02574 family)